MRKIIFLFIIVFLPALGFSQKELLSSGRSIGNSINNDSLNRNSTSNITPEAPVDWYKIISIKNDSIIVDTTLSIQKEYRFNYLRKDLFGRLPLPNEGQTYNLLDFGLTDFNPKPEMGFKAKHASYLDIDNINYYHVPTPISDLMYKSVMEQGQILDALVAINTSERFNFSVAYKGLRSVGKYINSLSSNGNFRLSASYRTKKDQYSGKYHFTAQDIENGENGGIVNLLDFESGNAPFTERARLEVFYKDATSYLEGKRLFADHSFRINPEKGSNNLLLSHRFYYENKEFSFSQKTPHERLGNRYLSGEIHDKTDYYQFYNRLGAIYQNHTLGDFMFFVEHHKYQTHYNRVILNQNTTAIPNKLDENLNSVGGQYTYHRDKWKGTLLYTRSLDNKDLSELELHALYHIDKQNTIDFKLRNINKLPDIQYNLYQSNYIGYNWHNDFNNQNINDLKIQARLKWFEASVQATSLTDYLYFSNSSQVPNQLITTPKQYEKTIGYFGAKLSKEFRLGKFALDNTFLYQEVAQDDDILNVPRFVIRNTLYFSDHIFKKAMFIQTGVSFNYFTKYYANDYNGVIGSFFVQNQRMIGDFPVFDFFINAKVSTAQIFLKAEHFNSSFTGYNFYATPNMPYRDFIIRFGISWKFFS